MRMRLHLHAARRTEVHLWSGQNHIKLERKNGHLVSTQCIPINIINADVDRALAGAQEETRDHDSQNQQRGDHIKPISLRDEKADRQRHPERWRSNQHQDAKPKTDGGAIIEAVSIAR